MFIMYDPFSIDNNKKKRVLKFIKKIKVQATSFK